MLGLHLADLRPGEHGVFVAEGKGATNGSCHSPRFFTTMAAYLETERPWPAVADRLFVVLKGPRRGQPLTARWKGQAMHHPITHTGRAFEVVPDLAPQPGERLIIKTVPSAFFGTALASLLTFHSIDTLIVTGMVTSGCVRATVVDAFPHNYRVTVPEECVADRGDLSHTVSLFAIHIKHGDVPPLADVLDYLGRFAPRRTPAPPA